MGKRPPGHWTDRPTRGTALLAMVLTALAAACGAQVERSGEDDEDTGNGASGASGDTEDSDPTGVIDLGRCEPGEKDDRTNSCPWLGSDGLCYETKEAACACLCPARGNTACQSPLFAEGPRIPVSCN